MSTSKFLGLEGVPFAINPVFLYDQSKIDNSNLLTYNFDKAKSLLECTYDFNVENKVLTKPKKFKSKFSLSHRKKSSSFIKTEITSEEEKLNETPQCLSSSLPSSSVNLTQIPFSNVPLEPVKHYEIKNLQTTNNDKNNNFKDLLFDGQTLDPFNDLELKTLNDLEELKKILNEQEKTRPQQTQVGFYLNDNRNDLISSNVNVDNFGLPIISFIDLNDAK